MKKNIFFGLIFTLLSVTISAQNINSFFNDRTDFTAFRLKDQEVYFGGLLKDFSLGNWKFNNITRSMNTNTLLSKISLDDIVSSNSLTFTMVHQQIGSFKVRAAELFLTSPKPLSELGYKLAAGNRDPVSKYFIIAYQVDSQFDDLNKAFWRMIIYLNSSFDLVGEIVGRDGYYFIKSSYQYLPNNEPDIVSSRVPALFVVEKSDQAVIAVFNNLSLRILWQTDNLSFPDQSAIGIFTGIMSSAKFTIGESGRMVFEKKYIEKIREQEKQNQFIINEEDILTPDQIDNSNIKFDERTE